jgi:hypothetical protein
MMYVLVGDCVGVHADASGIPDTLSKAPWIDVVVYVAGYADSGVMV